MKHYVTAAMSVNHHFRLSRFFRNWLSAAEDVTAARKKPPKLEREAPADSQVVVRNIFDANFWKFYIKLFGHLVYHSGRQGDQIRRIFAYWANVFFVQFFENYKGAQICGLLFSSEK
jgi:hypothetical protein